MSSRLPLYEQVPELSDEASRSFEPEVNPKSALSKSPKKLIAVIFLFLTSLFSFVAQTEITSFLYSSTQFDQPYFLLLFTHGSWWTIWPIQVLSIATFKHFKISKRTQANPFIYNNFKQNFLESIQKQHINIHRTAGIIVGQYDLTPPRSIKEFIQSDSIRAILKSLVLITTVLTIAGSTWYVAMGLSPASDITAIYNCSAFTALVFAIPILKEAFTYTKLCSVLLAVLGVFFVAFSGGKNDDSENQNFVNRLVGDIIIGVGAILYGLYEVLYKKLVCPPSDAVSSKRQVAFSNFCASLIGIVTIATVWIIILFVHITDVSKFKLIRDPQVWLLIVTSQISNLIYSLSFLSLMSLTSPVLSSVSSLVTILFVGVFEWILFGVMLSFQQLLGDLFIVIGFLVLSYSYWNEITEEDLEDDDDDDY